MNYLFDRQFFLTIFKYYTFDVTTEQNIQKIYYQDSLYQGQGYFNEENQNFIKNGLGIFFNNKGEAFFGMFKENQINGEGNYFFWDGSFCRAKFKENQIHGNAIYIDQCGDVILLQFSEGILDGVITYFPNQKSFSISVQYESGKCLNNFKKFSFNKDKIEEIKQEIISKIFEDSQDEQVFYTNKDIFKYLKTKSENDKFFGCYLLENSHLIIGSVNKQLILHGVGIIVDFSGKIQIGDFEQGKQQNWGYKIQKKYCFYGEFYKGQYDGYVVVQAMEKKQYKECTYEQGKCIEVQNEGEGLFNQIIGFQWDWIEEQAIEQDFPFHITAIQSLRNILIKQENNGQGQRVTFGNNIEFFQNNGDENIQLSFKEIQELENEKNNQLKIDQQDNVQRRETRAKSLRLPLIEENIISEKNTLEKIQESTIKPKSKSIIEEIKISSINRKKSQQKKINNGYSLHKMNCNEFVDEVKMLKEVMKDEYKDQMAKKYINQFFLFINFIFSIKI